MAGVLQLYRPHQLLIAFTSTPFWPGSMETQIPSVGVESQAVPFPASFLSAHTWLFMKGAVEKGHYGPCSTMNRVWTTHTLGVMNGGSCWAGNGCG